MQAGPSQAIFVKCLKNEVEAMHKLGSHPNVVQLLGLAFTHRLNDQERTAALVLEYLSGGDLVHIAE